MNRVVVAIFLTLTLGGAVTWSGCSTATGKSADRAESERAPIAVTPVAAVEQPIARFIRATGTLMAEDQAEVAAEIAGASSVRRSSAALPWRKATC
jgi:multidrug efflux pump subunit AcrA (membrane-fusion protein)